MLRHLIPRFDYSGWSGSALTRDPSPKQPIEPYDEVIGFCLCVQWLGLMIEIGAGRVS